ncbi:MAG TPA: 5-formyltetrahydrofolate cyclo-ligase, partial [Polyangia bacterium]|nr:5-formyltetrahydrofolate cyclo-ligase [Polyangia bacterium]
MVPTPSPLLVEQKRQLRRTMAERRDGLPLTERQACARAAAARLLGLPALGAGRGISGCVSGYVAIRGELDPAEALAGARAAGFIVVLPRIDTRVPPHLCFHEATGSDALVDGPHGLREPPAACAEVPVEGIDVMLVPGLAFDAAGRRLGYGGGYYDAAGRALRERRPASLLVGFAYDFQIVDACPTDARDVA